MKKLIDNKNKNLSVKSVDLWGRNSSMHNNIPAVLAGNSNNIHLDPNVSVSLPTVSGNRLPIGPSVTVGFDVVAWHEIVGQESSHPSIPDNSFSSSSNYVDPVIEIENQFRRWNNIPERFGKYFRKLPKGKGGGHKCCGNE